LSQDASQLTHRAQVVGDVLEHVGHEEQVEAPVREPHAGEIGGDPRENGIPVTREVGDVREGLEAFADAGLRRDVQGAHPF
jgi:hypothetical protein